MTAKWVIKRLPVTGGIAIYDGDELIAGGLSEANANLIARAPRLEEENKELVEALKEVYAGLMRQGRDSWTVRQIREVLSKVKGE